MKIILFTTLFLLTISIVPVFTQAQNLSLNTREVQKLLLDRGYKINTVDGKYGPNTAAAIKEFQRIQGLKISGYNNLETNSALKSSPYKLRANLAKTQSTKQLSSPNDTSSFSFSNWLVLVFIFWGAWKVLGPSKKKAKVLPLYDDVKDYGINYVEPFDDPEENYYEDSPLEEGEEDEDEDEDWDEDENDDDDDDDEEDEDWDERLESFLIEDEKINTMTVKITPQQRSEVFNYPGNRDRNSKSNKSISIKCKKQGDKCWIPKGQTIEVARASITNGMVYFGKALPTKERYGGTENCLINPRLKVDMSKRDVALGGMPYWPSYSDISPRNRREYLDWLADGAKDPNANIGYVFLYFYGLERRLFLDQSKEDADDIIGELKRLLSTYGDNYSVNRYIGEALSFSSILLSKGIVKPEISTSLSNNWELPLNVCVYIGDKLKNGLPLLAEDLLLWFLNHPETYLRTPAKRLENEYLSLMKLRLKEEYPDGLNVRKPQRRISPSYSSSSNSFEVDLSDLIGEIPDISGLNQTIKKIKIINDIVTDELDKLSRYLGRNPEGVGGAKATSLLPKELIHEFGGDHIKELQDWIVEQQQSSDGAVVLADLIQKSTEHNGTKVTKTIHKEVEQVMGSMGWNMVPAYNELIGTLKPDHRVLLLPDTEGGLAIDNPSADFLLAIFELALGSYIAHADTRVLEVEVEHLADRVENLNHLCKTEKKRLHNYVKWLSVQEADFGAIKRKLKSADPEAKKTFSNIAIAIAAADGQIVPTEVKALEAIYKSMGFDQQDLYSSLHSMSGLAPAKSISSNSSQAKAGPISLDMNRVSATLHDTAKASTLLASIFEDDEVETAPEPIIDEETVDDTTTIFEGLDGPHTQLLQELLERDEWPRADFEKLASSLKLMTDGAMETINEWAFDLYDDAIIEDDEPITIYKELISEGT